MTTTPNMGLILPDPGVTAGPEYASLNDAAFQEVDQHDHASGSGVPVSTAGLNINASLNFNGWNGYGFRSVRMNSQPGSLIDSTDIGCIYVKNGELAYRDILGNEVVLTSSGSVAGATGTITGLVSPASASFSAVANAYSWLYDTAKPARMVLGDLHIYPYDGVTAPTNWVVLKSPAALASTYSWIFPTLQTTQSNVVSVGVTGDIVYGLAAGSAGAPSIAFAADLDTGFFYGGSGDTRYTADGTPTVGLSSAGVRVANGSVTVPSVSFLSDTTLGLYRVSAGKVGLGPATTTTQLLLPDGAAATPALSFTEDPDTGIWRSTTNTLVLQAAGAAALTLTSTLGTFGSRVRVGDGTNALPAYSFTSATDTGIYYTAVGGGSLILTNNVHGIYLNQTGLSWEGTTNGVKWRRFLTGSIADGASTTISISGATAVGAVARDSAGNGVRYDGPVAGYSHFFNFGAGVSIDNNTGGARTYQGVVFYFD